MPSKQPIYDYTGTTVGHFRIVERAGAARSRIGRDEIWIRLCELCGDWGRIRSSGLRAAQASERRSGIKARCERCRDESTDVTDREEADQNSTKPRSPARSKSPKEPSRPGTRPSGESNHFENDFEIAIALATWLDPNLETDSDGWPLRGANGATPTRFDPANDWDDAMRVLARLLAADSADACPTFFRDLERQLALPSSVIPEWPDAFRQLVLRGPRLVCSVILTCCPSRTKSTEVEPSPSDPQRVDRRP